MADVAVRDGLVVAVGEVDGDATEVLDARGLVVTPGYVDPHTHYDGQVTWDDRLAPSSWHGVTTAVLGNCGVGFAPVRPERREWLVQLMEGVEDIPGTALHAGIRWSWETFPEYLDALEQLPRAVDVAAQLPHGALRAYVMDERGADDEQATEDDIARMAVLAEEAARAGAVGFSTNRLPSHAAKDGRPVPGTTAADDELVAIAHGVAAGGGGVIQSVSAEGLGLVPGGYRDEVDRLTRISLETGLPTTMALTQNEVSPELWREVLDWVHESTRQGAVLVPQIAGRPLGLLLGFSDPSPVRGTAELRRGGAPAARREGRGPRRTRSTGPHPGRGHRGGAGRLRVAHGREAVPARRSHRTTSRRGRTASGWPRPRPGVTLDEACYDVYLREGGRQLVLFTLNGYAHFDTEHIRVMLEDPTTMLGLADGGAHCSLICDASVYTSMLSYWARDRAAGTVPLELAVAKMTSVPAALYGFDDRGVLEPGRRADINVIDLDRLQLLPPVVAHDLPTDAPRVVQRAVGYVRTYVAGVAVTADDADTGARPGQLVRRR